MKAIRIVCIVALIIMLVILLGGCVAVDVVVPVAPTPKPALRIASDDPDTEWQNRNPRCRHEPRQDALGRYKVRRCPRKGR